MISGENPSGQIFRRVFSIRILGTVFQSSHSQTNVIPASYLPITQAICLLTCESFIPRHTAIHVASCLLLYRYGDGLPSKAGLGIRREMEMHELVSSTRNSERLSYYRCVILPNPTFTSALWVVLVPSPFFLPLFHGHIDSSLHKVLPCMYAPITTPVLFSLIPATIG
jgi:hypothetical protein